MPMRSQIKNAQTAQNLQREIRPAPERHIATVPGDPVHIKEDVTTFFLHHGFEGFNQFGRKKPERLACSEQTEGEKAVDALAVAGDHEGPFGIAWHNVFRLGLKLDAIGFDEIGEHMLMAAFLESVEFNGAF